MSSVATSMTQIARLEARRNEDLVIAENALAGERRVTIVRLATVGLFAVSVRIVGPLFGLPENNPPARLVSVAIYVTFAVALFFRLRSVKPDARRSMFFPLLASLADFAFMFHMAYIDERTYGITGRPMTAVAFAVLICFSVVRYSWIHVASSVALASTGYVGLGLLTGHTAPPSTVFVVGGFIALGILIGWTNYAVRHMFTELRRRDHLSRFLPAQVVERVLASGGAPLVPVQREVTVLFSDIRDFTALAEALAPREVLELLDDLFGRLTQVVKGHDGIVNKFLGDGMLAVWGVPDKDEIHAENALRAALDLQRVVVEINQTRATRNLPALRLGVGVHTGVVAAGMLGGPDQHEYTVIGDAVNVASRIEGLNKTLGTDVLVSDATWSQAGARFKGRRLAEQTVRGRGAPVVVWALESAG